MGNNNKSLVFILGLSVFAAITTEMGVIGLLPQLAEKYQISTSQAGLLVSVFSLTVAIAGPFVTLVISRMNRKHVLLFIMLLFTISNVIYAFSPVFEVSLVFRIIPAIMHASLFSLGIAVAVSLAKPELKSKASAQVFAGVAIGLVLGVPLTSFVAEKISLESAFLFGAVISAIALVGILVKMPSMPVKDKLSYRKQLSILRRVPVWLNISTVVFVFATMFSVYSYFAEYLGQVTKVNAMWVSVLLMIFGLFGVFGNFIFSNFLQKNVVRTVILYPVSYLGIYLLVYYFGLFTIPMILFIIVWGTIHSGGLIVSQTWLSKETMDAPEFGNSLYLSFSNLGITLGTSLGGLFITKLGVNQLILSGVFFSILAFVSIILKLKLFGPGQKEGK
ncbi:MFS transporter (plasmid) [Priestia megaterium]|uniref:MFS transporter n=1 Tax=Priestia megaterium TaxID=1404 RepID=UPI0035BE9B97